MKPLYIDDLSTVNAHLNSVSQALLKRLKRETTPILDSVDVDSARAEPLELLRDEFAEVFQQEERTEFRIKEILAKNPVPNTIVANKQQFMEDLVLALERALSMAKQPAAKAGEVISYVREQFENIENPHRALELELARLVEAKTPPNREFYKTRVDQSEFAPAFFQRNYGRFYEAGVLRYKSQLQAMDADFAHLIAQYKGAVRLLTKREENDEALAKVGPLREVLRLAGAATRRKTLIA